MTSTQSKVLDEGIRRIWTGEPVEACLADYPDAQAETEAQEEKAQVLEDARRQAPEVAQQVERTCPTTIDATRFDILEAMKYSSELAKETTASILAMMEENVRTELAPYLSQSSPEVKQPEEGASDSEGGDSFAVTDEGKAETQSRKEGGPDLGGLYETAAKLRESERLLEATILGNSADAVGEKPADVETAPPSEVGRASQAVVETAPQGEAEQEPASQEDDPQGDEEQEPSAAKAGEEGDEEKRPDAETAGGESGEKDAGLYRGNVTVVLPERVRASWMLPLRQLILETPSVQILGESYAEKDGARLKLTLGEPVALPDLLRELPDVRKVTDRSNGGAPKSKGLKRLSGNHQQQQILVIELGANAIC